MLATNKLKHYLCSFVKLQYQSKILRQKVKKIETKSQKNWDKKSGKLRLKVKKIEKKVKKIETYKKEILKINDFLQNY